MQLSLICLLLSLISSCDNNVYYATFDYKTMTCKNPIKKQENCVRYLSQTKDKIEIEVHYYGNVIKRTFIKKENHWYSKFKYEEISIPSMRVSYGGIHEVHYYIFPTHVVYKDEVYLNYIDLIENKMYMFDGQYNKNIKDSKLEELQVQNYYVVDYYENLGTLFERDRTYNGKGNLKEEVINNHSNEPLLDIFFWMDEDIYYLGATKVPIYEEF